MEMTTSYLDIYEIEPRSTYRRQRPGNIVDAGLFSEGAQVNAVNFVYETPFKSRLFVFITKLKKLLK